MPTGAQREFCDLESTKKMAPRSGSHDGSLTRPAWKTYDLETLKIPLRFLAVRIRPPKGIRVGTHPSRRRRRAVEPAFPVSAVPHNIADGLCFFSHGRSCVLSGVCRRSG